MPHTDAESREQLLGVLAKATDGVGAALVALGEAYEQLDDDAAERLEAELFRPTQSAYGRAQRTHSQFAARHDIAQRVFAQPPPGAPSRGVKGFIEDATQALAAADGELAALQDSMLPVEVGDADLRAGLEQVRTLLAPVRSRARQFLRTFGR